MKELNLQELKEIEFDILKVFDDFCKENNIRLWQFPERFENKDFHDYMKKIWGRVKSM